MHQIFIPSPNAVKLRVCNLTSVSFRHHLLVCSREVSFVQSADTLFRLLATLLFVSVSLNN